MTTNNSVNTTLSGQTGTGKFVGDTSPTLVTPNVGVATATSLTFGGGVMSAYAATTSWTPVFTFATPGNLSVSYANQNGLYVQIGSIIFLQFYLTCTPTFTTSSGALRITGLPATGNNNTIALFDIATSVITYPAGTTVLYAYVNSAVNYLTVGASGTTVAGATVSSTNFTSGVAIAMYGSGFYFL